MDSDRWARSDGRTRLSIKYSDSASSASSRSAAGIPVAIRSPEGVFMYQKLAPSLRVFNQSRAGFTATGMDDPLSGGLSKGKAARSYDGRPGRFVEAAAERRSVPACAQGVLLRTPCSALTLS